MRVALYKGTPAGIKGIYNRLVRWWTNSPYSHVEIVFSTGWSASSSYMDGGVRFKVIDFDPAKWDFIDLPKSLERAAFAWFIDHRDEKYDLLGNLHFVIAPVADDRGRWFCSEAVAAALGIPDPWRYDPASLASLLRFTNQPASAGFSI